MGHRKDISAELDDISGSEFSPRYSSNRQKPVPSKKELRRICMQKDRSKSQSVFPEPEYDFRYMTVLR